MCTAFELLFYAVHIVKRGHFFLEERRYVTYFCYVIYFLIMAALSRAWSGMVQYTVCEEFYCERRRPEVCVSSLLGVDVVCWLEEKNKKRASCLPMKTVVCVRLLFYYP